MRALISTFPALLVAAVLATACGDDSEPAPPTAAPTAAATETAVPDAERPGDEGFRQFAALLDAAVRRADVAFIMDRLQTQHVVCTDENTPPQMGGPACTVVGDEFEGLPMAHWRSEGALVRTSVIEEQLRDRFLAVVQPRAGDGFGGGEARVYAISDTRTLGTHAALLTAIIERPAEFAGDGPLRVAIHTAWTFDGGRWLMTYMMNAYVLGEEFLRPDDIVKDSYYPNWERYSPP